MTTSPASGHFTDDTTASYNLTAHYKTPRPTGLHAMSPTYSRDETEESKIHGRRVPHHSGQFELLRGLQLGQRYKTRPPSFSGTVQLQRKMFGKRRRHCLVKDGMVHIYRSAKEVDKGRIWRKIDLAHSVVSYRKVDCVILIDADDRRELHRFKVDRNSFNSWIDHLRMHRLYRQDQFCGEQVTADPNTPRSPLTEYLPGIPAGRLEFGGFDGEVDRETSKKRVVEWLIKSENVDSLEKEYTEASFLIFELGTIIEQLEKYADLASERHSYSDEKSPKIVGRSLFGRLSFRNRNTARNEQTGSGKKGTSPGVSPRSKGSVRIPASISASSFATDESQGHTKLAGNEVAASASPATSRMTQEDSDLYHRDTWLREEYLRLAKEAHKKFRALLRATSSEHTKLKEAQQKLKQHVSVEKSGDSPNLPMELSSSSSSPMKSIYKTCDRSASMNLRRDGLETTEKTGSGADQKSEKPSAVRTASSVYYDANEALSSSEVLHPSPPLSEIASSYTLSDIESEGKEEEESGTSESNSWSAGNQEEQPNGENRDNDTLENSLVHLPHFRERLPAPMPPPPSLFKILYNAIGRDFTRFPLPVAALEPLSLLQVLCEELEYTDLLDQAVALSDPTMRMVYVSAFAASRYGSTTFRIGRKPFNPLLGETFEFICPHLGWKYLAQQVCHHPSVSACYAEGRGWKLWQAAEAAVVFGGRSVEARPLTPVFLHLERWNETYTWNKVTTYLTNLLSGPPFVIDHFGEMMVQCLESQIKCKLHFEKMTNTQRGNINGKVLDTTGRVVHTINGKWTDNFYLAAGTETSSRCIWRLAALPSDHDRYYGFTRFALALNETNQKIRGNVACTDSRFRPDQRCLENGQLEDAEKYKKKLEADQRERLKMLENKLPMWFRQNQDTDAGVKWEFTGDYWRSKENNFKGINFVPLW